jgi:hypothetical protein
MRNLWIATWMAAGVAWASVPASAQNPWKFVVAQSPSTGVAGVALGRVSVAVVDANDVVVPISGLFVHASLGAGPTGAELSGTLAQPTVLGLVSFGDLSVATAGPGFTIHLTARNSDDADTLPFDVGPGPAHGLRFKAQPKDAPAWSALDTIEVAVVDEFGNAVPDANVPVTLQMGQNPGVNLVHSSGSVGNPILELVDPLTPALLPPILTGAGAPKSVAAMALDVTLGRLVTTDTAGSLSHVHVDTGQQTFVGAPGTLPSAAKGLAVDPISGVYYAGMINEPNLYVVNPLTAAWVLLGPIQLAGDLLLNVSGLAFDPTDGTLYGCVQVLSQFENRAIVRIDPSSLSAVLVGFTGDKPAGLAFLPNGILVAVTGDGGFQPERLFTVSKTTGAMAPLLTLGNGDSGESIATVPARLWGFTTVQTSGGVASFAGMRVSAPAGGYTLYAMAPGLALGESRPFAVAAPDLTGKVAFATSSLTFSENVGTLQAIVTLDAPKPHDVVAWVRATGTASGPVFPNADHDFPTFTDVPVTIPAGQTSASISVKWNDDTLVEPNETLILTLQRAALGGVGPVNVLTITIQNND